MRSNVKIFFLVFTIFVILLVPFVPTHAQKADASLDGVVVQLSDGSKVKVNFENYAIAFIMENELFDFLRGVQSEPNIVYVSSGNKYIDFNDYAIEFIFNGGDESGAINTSPPISSEIINEIKIFDGFDDNGEPILSPIASRDIYFKDIPGEIKQIIPGKYGVGIKNVDAVITCRELADMIKEAGIDFLNLNDDCYDPLLGAATGAATIFGTTGGVTEAALRTVKEVLTGEPLDQLNLGIMGVRDAKVTIADRTYRIGIVSGLANAAKVLDEVRAGQSQYDWIEVMACPHGCVGGGGQPLPANWEATKKRAQGLATMDQSNTVRKSHENEDVLKLYAEYLGEPLGGKAHQLLHTSYRVR